MTPFLGEACKASSQTLWVGKSFPATYSKVR